MENKQTWGEWLAACIKALAVFAIFAAILALSEWVCPTI